MCEEEGEKFPIFYFHFHFHYSGLFNGEIVIWTPLAKEKTRFLSQHSDRVDWLSFSPDGRFLASADSEGKFIIWSAEVNKKTERIKREWYLIVIQFKSIQRYFRTGNPFTSTKEKEEGAIVFRGSLLRLRMSLTTNLHLTQTMARYKRNIGFLNKIYFNRNNTNITYNIIL
jgi:WD40 repeat protein